jgi:nucleobase:cation symporter-1, NCS1 family
VVLVDYFVFRRGRYAAEEMTRGRGSLYWYRGGVFWRATLAWLIGFATTIPFIGSAMLPWSGQAWQGPMAHFLGGMDFSGIVGAVVSGILYYLLGRRYFSLLQDV